MLHFPSPFNLASVSSTSTSCMSRKACRENQGISKCNTPPKAHTQTVPNDLHIKNTGSLYEKSIVAIPLIQLQDAIFIDIKIITVRPPVRIRINTYY